MAEIPPAEVDRLNVYRAGLEAMRRAVLALDPAPQHLLVDARRIPGVPMPQTAVVGGDAREAPIAAASIISGMEDVVIAGGTEMMSYTSSLRDPNGDVTGPALVWKIKGGQIETDRVISIEDMQALFKRIE